MINIIKNKFNALALLAVAALFTGLVSCSDTSNPLASKSNNSGLVASTNSVDNNAIQNGTSDENLGLGGPGCGPDKKAMDPKKRALPLPCLNLSTEQMTALGVLRKDTETKNAQLRKDFETQVKALRDAALAASSGTTTTVNKDSLNAIISDLIAQDKALTEQLRAKEQALRTAMDAIRASYKDQITAAGSDRVARKAIEDKMKAEMKVANDAYLTDTKDLRDQQKAIRTKIETTKRALMAGNGKGRGPVLDPTAKAAFEAQIKVLADALKLALDANEQAFLDAFRNGLTAEQQAIYDAWLAGTPCNPNTKKTTK